MSSKEHVLPKAEVIEACRKGDYDKVAYFLSGRRSKKSRTPLNFFRSISDSHWLVDYRDDKSQLSLLHHSALEGQNEISKLLMDFEPLLILAKSTKNILPIHLASWNGHLEIVKMMLFVRLDKPVNLVNQVNIFNETPLHLAIQRGHMNVIAYLLRKNADPFIRNENKENVLDVAARIGHPTVIKLLCQTWPDFPVMSAYESLKVETAEHRRPFPAIYPFHLAAKHNHVDCMKILREFGFSIDYTTEDGTALHVAAACGQVDAVRYLLREGINTNIKNQHGQTVLTMIIDLQENRRPEIAQFVKNPEGWKECRAIVEGIDKSDSGRDSEGSDTEPIWQQLPAQASVQYYPDQRKNNRSIYRPPSVSAKLRDYSPEANDVSVKSDFDYASGTLVRTWNSKMYDEQTGAPRFPKTNPYSNNSRHHSFNRVSDTLPIRLNQNRTKPSPPRPTILPDQSPYKGTPPKEPPHYDDWEKSRGFRSIQPGAYDNVPQTDMNLNSESLLKRQTGCSTLPAVRHLNTTPVRPTLREDTFQVETTPTNDNIYKNHFTMSRTTCDREDSLGLTQSPRLDTRASSITSSLTYACSTLEKTEPRYPTTSRAPLALPEEITGSVSGGTVFMCSPEKEGTHVTAVFLSGDCHDGEKTPDSPPSPNTSKAAIFGALCGKDNNASFFATHIGLGSTASSTLSDVSTGSPDSPPQQSPTHISNDDNTGVRIRRYNGTSNIFNTSESSASTSSSTDDKKLSDEADWNKVTELFETFGAAPCRESVFVRDYEPRVAVYLRDRGSKALTLQMIDNVVGERRSIQIPSRLMTVTEWLETDVGISNREARHIGTLFEKYGYDRYTQLKGSLNYSVMANMSISGTNQLLIMNLIEQMVEKRPSANGFFYVSDWLSSLELTDYLANFINSGFKNMTTIVNSNMDETVLNSLGVYQPGHIARIQYSLHRANQEIQLRETTPPTTNAPPRPPRAAQKPCVECSKINFEKIKKLLLTDGSSFCANQLGINEISSVHGTKEAHLTMHEIKENLKEWDAIPKVLLEMNCNGIRVYDAKKKILLATHKVYNINVVCQDRKDLNFFSFIARNDQNRFFCYTYCVLTSDITFEIIHTIGMMFDIRRRLDKNISLDFPFNCCHSSHEKR